MARKKQYHIRNWPEYNKALVNRGRLTLWFDENSIAEWHNTEPTGQRGRQQDYSHTTGEERMNTRIVVFLILLGFPINAMSISPAIKEKYRYTLITNDHGILNEHDLASYTGNLPKTTPFSGAEKELSRSYWQCFPRNDILITLEDTGSSPEDMNGTDTMADLKVTACAKPGVLHEYIVRAVMPTYAYEKTFHRWRKLMKNEPYVCLGGEFGEHKRETRKDGVKREVYTWTFDRIKTKKGCDSYFDGECEET